MTEKPTWREMLRYYSVWALAAAGSLPLIWRELQPSILPFLPGDWLPYITLAVAVLGIIGRRVPQ